ncbi:MAG: DUF1214 domain-containing protein [Rhodocyclaceae bacterium]|jgi:hypothetical protein|nr:DUF1214 domain-containing protein [Rhodocyclaceae bacterium]
MKALEPVGDRLMAKWGRTAPTEAERQDMYRLALSALAGGYLGHVYMDPARPTWTPLWGHALNHAGPCPDYIYLAADVDPKGSYRISGFRGTSVFVEITQQAFVMVGDEGTRVPAPATHDLDTLQIGPDGYFSVILSAERPAGHSGDWWQLFPNTSKLCMRKASNDWLREVDAQVAIERLDEVPPMGPAEIAQRFSNMAAWIERLVGFDIDLARYYREHHGFNRLERSKIIADIGGLPNQVYYDGTHDIRDDEALIIDTALPKTVRYWSVLVADDRFGTVDWFNRQSSLNGFQARIDADGRFRAVISARDPGIHNWLDKGSAAENPSGIMQLRWNKPSDAPDPVVTKVALADVRKHLPAETPLITPEERKAQLRLRREGAQMRRIW